MNDNSTPLGVLPDGWNILQLKNVSTFITKGTTPTTYGFDWADEGVPFLRSECVAEEGFVTAGLSYITDEANTYLKRSEVKSGDILITITGNIGRVIVYPESLPPGNINQHIARVRVTNTEVLDNQYLCYVLNTAEYRNYFNRITTGLAYPQISLVQVRETAIPKPRIEIQNKIAKILTTIDQLIEKTHALIDKHTVIKQGMMADLFTRGIDPTTGQLRPPVEQAPQLYKETELGWVPREWEVKMLRNVAVKIQDGTHFSPQTSEGDYLYLTSKNIRFGYLELENIERISESEHNSIYARCDVKYGDLLLTKDGANTGNAALNMINEPFSMLSSVAFIRTDGKLAHVDFLLHYLLSLEGQKRLKELMSGNAIPRLTLTKINNFKVFQPVGNEQRLIADRLNSTKERVDKEKCYLEKLKEMKKGLMQDLLTGSVEVSMESIC